MKKKNEITFCVKSKYALYSDHCPQYADWHCAGNPRKKARGQALSLIHADGKGGPGWEAFGNPGV